MRRDRFVAERGTRQERSNDWRELSDRGRIAAAGLICTQDRMLAESAEIFAALGYHIYAELGKQPDSFLRHLDQVALESAKGVLIRIHGK